MATAARFLTARVVNIPRRPVKLRGGRPCTWVGGLAVVEALKTLHMGKALRIEIPPGLTYDTVRSGIYHAARVEQIAVRIARGDGEITTWQYRRERHEPKKAKAEMQCFYCGDPAEAWLKNRLIPVPDTDLFVPATVACCGECS